MIARSIGFSVTIATAISEKPEISKFNITDSVTSHRTLRQLWIAYLFLKYYCSFSNVHVG